MNDKLPLNENRSYPWMLPIRRRRGVRFLNRNDNYFQKEKNDTARAAVAGDPAKREQEELACSGS
ncbi:hypothetical protein [Salinicola salarius]|uniref:hypothetical protein n=1 Tax=Salinicola salarius TaxID=430457 RepID=UPI00117AC89E|nr:hypothetical protein [Salinicola salarius]